MHTISLFLGRNPIESNTACSIFKFVSLKKVNSVFLRGQQGLIKLIFPSQGFLIRPALYTETLDRKDNTYAG